MEKEVKRFGKNGVEITKAIFYKFYLSTVQDLWQAHYQILLIISLKEFINLNVNTDNIIKKCKRC